MRSPKAIRINEFVRSVEEILIIEVGKSIRGKFGQADKKVDMFVPHQNVNSGVFVFNSNGLNSLKSIKNPPSFFSSV